MASIWRIRRAILAITTSAAIVFGVLVAPIALAPAQAQISEDAQIALEQYGMWRPHPRFGEVWVPAGIPPDWRPYEYGHWVYTDDWGWYWVSDDVEANWGWVVYHYGRWAFERGFGWFWVPGDEWAPAWVNWRYGDEYVGWAPLPPDELVGAYEAEPTYWVFVPGRYLAAPRVRTYVVPVYRRSVILRTTNIVNRTVVVHGARLAVNPGIPPAFVARVSGAPVATYRVRPRVFASTQGVSGAVQVGRDELRGPKPGGPPGRPGGPGRPVAGPPSRLPPVSVERTTSVIQPSAAVTAPQPLGKNEPGRLGTNPPRAAQGVSPPSSTPPSSTAPAQREDHRDRVAPGGPPPGGPAPQQPNIVRPTPPQASPPTPPPGSPPPQQRQVQPPQPPQPPQGSPPQREEHRERVAPGGPPGGSPQQPNVVRPTPPQPPVPPPQQQRQVQPPPGPPPQQQQRQVQPPPGPPPQQQRQVQPPPPQQRQVQPSPQGGGGQRPPGPPPKKPPPKPGEEEKK